MSYSQAYDENVYVTQATLIPGLRNKPEVVPQYPDYLTERPIAPDQQINNGYPFVYLAQRTKSFQPADRVTNTYVNGKWQDPRKIPKFKAQTIVELGVASCS